MAYCVHSDVTAEFKKLTLNSTGVSEAKVTEWISQLDAYIDGKVGLKYEVPVTGTEALKIVKQISIWLAAHRLKGAINLETGDDKAELVTPGNLEKKAETMLTEIVEGKLLLRDATRRSSTDGVKSFVVSNAEEHTIKKGTKQW